MSNRLVQKLKGYVHLSDADQMQLIDAVRPGLQVAARTDIMEQGDDPRAVNIILDGWACRYRQLANGRRQIFALLLPGDLREPQIFLLDKMDHAIGAITSVQLGQIGGGALRALRAHNPNLDRALHREALVTAAVQREWTVSLGSRTGIERLAHLFCEVHARLKVVGLTEYNTYRMPITQTDLADALGQTGVHINRTLQEIRSIGLIAFCGRRLTICDPSGARPTRTLHSHRPERYGCRGAY